MARADPVRVALIGCGLIGSRWDEGRSDDGPSLTHARAFSRHPGSVLVACCDADPARARAAASRWGARAYTDPRTMFAEQAVDLAVVASSSAARAAVIVPALQAGVGTLVIEKPLATTLAESRRLVALLAEAGARSIVNYLRHWDPSMVALGEQLRGGHWGGLQRLVGSYGKGLANCGSHMVDLARFLCDAMPLRARALESPLAASEADWSQGADPAHDAQVELTDAAGRHVRLDMIATDQTAFTCWELRILARDAVCDISRGGRSIALQTVTDDSTYPGYRIPGPPVAQPAHALEAMDRMADEAVALASGEIASARCDARNALVTALAVAAVQRSAAEDGRWIAIEEAF